MPAILTHDFFGREAYDKLSSIIGTEPEQRAAFLLGNQGPDPLFYLLMFPNRRAFHHLGGHMHAQVPTRVVGAMREAAELVGEEERPIARAYALGFLCHYLLDSTMHPLVYAMENAIVGAGIEGIEQRDHSNVHAEIEREFDEMVLFTRTGKTIRDYRPYQEVLQASDETLATIGRMYAYAAIKSLGEFPDSGLFKDAVTGFRTIQRLFYSPSGAFRGVMATAENGIRGSQHSFYRAMSHRDNAIESSMFANPEHLPWANPFTGQVSTEDFWDLFAKARGRADECLPAYAQPGFGIADAASITKGMNFSGNPVE